MAILAPLGGTKYNYRGSMAVAVGIAANDPGQTKYNYRGSMKVFAQTAVTLTFTTTSPLSNGMNGTAYTNSGNSIVAIGGQSPYTYAVTAGSLPTSVSMSSAGAFSGTPSATAVFNFTVTATDSFGNVGSKAFQITIVGALSITTSSPLPDGTKNSAYSQTIAATGGTATYSFAVTSGALQGDLTLHGATGVIDGTPTTSGDFSFTITVTDSSAPNFTSPKAFTLHIADSGGGGSTNPMPIGLRMGRALHIGF